MKVAVVTDSNTGVSPKDAEKEGIYSIPMPFMIQGESFEEEIDLTQEEFYKKLESGDEIATSQPSPERVLELWGKLLQEYDQIVHIPMSSGLSSSCQTARMLAEDFEGRVFVVNNHRISMTQWQSALDARELADAGMEGEEICSVLERTGMDASIYITLETLKYLKRGGRITPAAAALGTLLKIRPVLQIQGGKLDAFAKVRTSRQAKQTMIAAVENDLNKRFEDPEAKNTWLWVVHSNHPEAAKELQEELQGRFPEAMVGMGTLSWSVSCHTGSGALAIACAKKLNIEKERMDDRS